MRTVAVLAYQGMSVFETGIVTEVFGLPRPEFDFPWYELAICAEAREPVRLLGGATLHTGHGLNAFAAADTLIVPGVSDHFGKAMRTSPSAYRRAFQG